SSGAYQRDGSDKSRLNASPLSIPAFLNCQMLGEEREPRLQINLLVDTEEHHPNSEDGPEQVAPACLAGASCLPGGAPAKNCSQKISGDRNPTNHRRISDPRLPMIISSKSEHIAADGRDFQLCAIALLRQANQVWFLRNNYSIVASKWPLRSRQGCVDSY